MLFWQHMCSQEFPVQLKAHPHSCMDAQIPKGACLQNTLVTRQAQPDTAHLVYGVRCAGQSCLLCWQ